MIKKVSVIDARYPLGNGAGSDAIHRDPVYSYAVTKLHDDSGLTGAGLAFTLGEGNDMVCKAAQFYGEKLKGKDIEELMSDFGNIFNSLSNEQQFRWLRLLERHWIGADRGNQVSYTLKVLTDRHKLDDFRALVLREQPDIRACAVLPSRPDHELGYEYLPEEEISADRFAAIVATIDDTDMHEAIDLVHLQCAAGVCPI